MSDSKEKISAYLDDDLSLEELDTLSQHELPEAKGKYGIASRYHMMGDAMRGELGDASMLDISAQVHEALRDETPDSIAPTKTVSSSPARSPAFDFSAWFAPFAKPLGGLAVAASVALITVIAVTRVDTVTEPSVVVADSESQKVNIPSVAIVPRPASRPAVASVAVKNSSNAKRNAAFLDAYLAEHSEFAARDTMQGRMPYARAVSYESK